MTPRRLVLLVEGEGDVEAAPILLKRLLDEYRAFDIAFPDPAPLRVGGYARIIKQDFAEWRRLLQIAAKRRNLGGCILLLDGDSKRDAAGRPFCAMDAARCLAAEARQVGGGVLFSVAIVFACMEFESWLIAGARSLQGKPFADARKEIPGVIQSVPPDPESAPRDAKGWFRGILRTGYRPARDQGELTQLVDLNLIRERPMRSFRRLESAIKGLLDAIRSGIPAVSPAPE